MGFQGLFTLEGIWRQYEWRLEFLYSISQDSRAGWHGPRPTSPAVAAPSSHQAISWVAESNATVPILRPNFISLLRCTILSQIRPCLFLQLAWALLSETWRLSWSLCSKTPLVTSSRLQPGTQSISSSDDPTGSPPTLTRIPCYLLPHDHIKASLLTHFM